MQNFKPWSVQTFKQNKRPASLELLNVADQFLLSKAPKIVVEEPTPDEEEVMPLEAVPEKEEETTAGEAEPLMPATNGEANKSSEIIEISDIVETVSALKSGKVMVLVDILSQYGAFVTALVSLKS